jgi:two-component system nitrate/nitrite response regulator NarL
MNGAVAQAIRILLVDDHAMFREGLARMLERETDFRVAGQVPSASEALSVLAQSGANLVLLDVDLGVERAVDFVSGARRAGYNGRILVVTAGVSDREAVNLIQGGVAGILHKHHTTDELCGVIRQVAGGEVFIEKAYLLPLFNSINRTASPRRPSLTERDRTVLRFLLQGLTNRDIAARLSISEGAVKASLRHVCEKLGVHTRTQLVKVALEQYKDQL